MNQEKKCSKCNIGFILKNYVRPLIQTLTNDIRDYYMNLLTTKCLNTAVMLGIFMLGKKKGLEVANYCDSVETKNRHIAEIDNNKSIIADYKIDILKYESVRQIYYILLTDGDFKKKDSTIMFPGHVFIIEKIPQLISKTNKYNIYQSYINKYDLKGHFEKNNKSLVISNAKLVKLLDNLEYILKVHTWDNKCVKAWKDFTFVDTTDLLGSNPKGQLFICIRKSPVKTCLKYIDAYTNTKLKILEKQLKSKSIKDNDIYGQNNLYSENENALTNDEMKKSLRSIRTSISSEKKNGNI